MRITSVAIGSLSVLLALSTSVALALDFALHLPGYRDGNRFSTAESAGIGMLTNLGVVSGNPDGTFAPDRTLNRAEFLKVAYLSKHRTALGQFPGCFPDVPDSAWFTRYICAAKSMGVVAGNPDGLFHPDRPVNYAEATKMLAVLFGYSIEKSGAGQWYDPYFVAADDHGVLLTGNVAADHPLTRGEMARLAAAFVAESEGELDLYRRAEKGEGISSSSSSSVSSQTSSSASSKSSSSSSVSTDPLSDTTIRSQFLLLGEVSPVLGAAKVFLYEEPFDVTAISVNLTINTPTVESLLIYDDEKGLIGRATLDTSDATNRKYTVHVPKGRITVPKAVEKSFYVRANVRSREQGGIGNETVEISNVLFLGNGFWSNKEYTKATTESFRAFKTARGVIASIVNAKEAQRGLTPGLQQEVAAFKVTARKTDSSAQVRITDLEFQIELTGNVTLANPKLRADGLSDKFDCLISGSLLTCSSIPVEYGVVDQPRTLYLYADVSLGSGVTSAGFRLTLNEPGTITSDGSVAWTDGTTAFTWLAVDGPVAQGTYWKL